MVMKIHTGVPGAGKTYLLIKSFTDLFCSWDKETGIYLLQEKHKDKILVSNIEGLTLQHIDIETMMNERCLQLANTKFIDNIDKHDVEKMNDVIDEYYFKFMEERVRWFFNYAYQKQLSEKYGPIIYLIEESQRYFDSKVLGRNPWVRDVLYFFEKHRHFGHSIFIDTQHYSKIHKGIYKLCETEIRAKPRTLSVIGEFKYNEYSDGSKINQIPIVVRPKKKIFSTYKSMSNKEGVKTKKPVLKILIFVGIMVFTSIFVLNYAKNNIGAGSVQAATTTEVSAPVRKQVKSRSQRAPVQEIQIKKKKPGRWVHLAYTRTAADKITVVHPLTNAILPLKELDLLFKRQGSELRAYIPGE